MECRIKNVIWKYLKKIWDDLEEFLFIKDLSESLFIIADFSIIDMSYNNNFCFNNFLINNTLLNFDNKPTRIQIRFFSNNGIYQTSTIIDLT